METLRADVEKVKDGKLTNVFEKWANITQDQFVLTLKRLGGGQFDPPLWFFEKCIF